MKRTLLFLAVAALYLGSFAASVDTVTIYSKCMHKNTRCVVIRPDAYKNKQLRFPVVYLLHGYSDRYDTWVTRVPTIRGYSDRMEMIIVCPDGGYSSWYIDSLVRQKLSLPVAFMIDCGTSDFFYKVNQQLHQAMLELDIPHDYIERPGGHSWDYWGNAVEYQLLFFSKLFNNGNLKINNK